LWGERDGVRLAFGAALVLAAVGLVLQQRLLADDSSATNSPTNACGPTPEKNPLKLLRLMNPAMKGLLVTDILIRFCEQIPYAYVVLWCMVEIAGQRTAQVTGTQFGILTTVEMVTAILCYLPVAWLADRGGKKPYVLITFVNFTLFPLALYFCRSFWPLVLVFVLRGLKEFGEPTRKALILELAPEDRKAAAFGAYYLCRDTVVALGAFAGAFLWKLGPHANLFTASACGAAGTLWFACFGRDLSSASHRDSLSGPNAGPV
jgi:predicted MFS family arabinose efflux permease